MPLIDSSRFNLNPRSDTSGLANGIFQALTGIRQTQQQNQEKQALELQQQLKTTGAQFLRVRGMDFTTQKTELAKLAQAAFKRGEDISIFEEGLEIENPDEMNLFLTRIATRATDADKLLEAELAKTQETFTEVTNDSGNIVGQRSNLTNKVVSDPRASDSQETFKTLTDDNGNVVAQMNEQSGKVIADPRAVSGEGGDKKAKLEQGIRKEFTALSKDFIKVRDAHTRVARSAQDPSGAGDLAMIFNFMKVLDPGSVVRESEFRTAEGARGAIGDLEEEGTIVPAIVKQGIERLITGTRMLPEQRKDFLRRSEALFEGQLKNQKELERRFTDVSKRTGVNPQNVVLEFRLNDPSPPPKDLTADDLKNMTIEQLEALKAQIQ